jgi:hypothetical protein
MGEMAHTRLPKAASDDDLEPLTCELTELVKRIAANCRDPARLIELYYWSGEPELAEVMRQYMALPDEVRAALHAFLMLVADDPDSVTHRITREGEMILASPATAEIARTLAEASVRPPVVH